MKTRKSRANFICMMHGVDPKGPKDRRLADPKDELAARRASYAPPSRERLAGVLEKYAALVGPAREGAVTHAGGYVVHVDAVGEVAAKNLIYRERMETPGPLQVTVGP